MFKGTRMGETL